MRRPVAGLAVLFDEGDDLKDVLVGDYHGSAFRFGDAFSGGRYLEQEPDRYARPQFRATVWPRRPHLGL